MRMQIDSTYGFALRSSWEALMWDLCFLETDIIEFQPSNQMELSNHRGFRNSGDYCKAFFTARSGGQVQY
jgi:hypothetical protein